MPAILKILTVASPLCLNPLLSGGGFCRMAEAPHTTWLIPCLALQELHLYKLLIGLIIFFLNTVLHLFATLHQLYILIGMRIWI